MIGLLDYPPDHPLKLAREFALLLHGRGELTDRITLLFKEFMQNSSLPPKTLDDAKKQLFAHRHTPSVLAGVRAQHETETAPTDFAAIYRDVDAQPEQRRESAMCDFVYKSVEKHDWNNAMAMLLKISELTNPRNGKEYIRNWGQCICEAAGQTGVLSFANMADLRQILSRLRVVHKNQPMLI